MKRLAVGMLLGLLCSTAASAMMLVGDKAPDFTVPAALAGKKFTFSLAEALKKGPVVLYFYPKSFSPPDARSRRMNLPNTRTISPPSARA